MNIHKPAILDLDQIQKILSEWTDPEEVDKYLQRIENEINGQTEFNMHFWLAKEVDKVLGVVGLSDPLPKIVPYAKTSNPAEIKILYVDGQSQGRGVGKQLIHYIEIEAKKQNYTELLVRSADKYKHTAYGFYEKMGYLKLALIEGGDSSKTMQLFEKII